MQPIPQPRRLCTLYRFLQWHQATNRHYRPLFLSLLHHNLVHRLPIKRLRESALNLRTMYAACTRGIPSWCNTLYCDKTLLIQLKPVNSNLLFSNSLLPLPVLSPSSSQLSRSSSLSLTIFRTPLESWRWWNSNAFQCNQLVIDTWMKAWSIKN